jgi:hypothetical protein
MATPFALTHHPARVTATGFQPLYLALDVSAFDALDVELGVLSLEGTSPTVTVQLWSSLQKATDSGWMLLHDFGNKSGVFNAYYRARVQRSAGLLRYLRWKVTTLGGSGSPAATFFIRGVGRSLSGAV